MLQGVRDNMKGTLVAVVVILFIIPMVLSGIGGSFLGSVAGTDAASVDGTSISNAELRREMYMQKQRMIGQGGVDPSSDMLKDENLREPVLNQLTRRTSLIVAAEDAGMAVPDALVGGEIAKTQEFFTDGKFDQEKYKRLLANVGYTPATYQAAIRKEILLSQNGSGLSASGFVTEAEISQLVGLLHQKRSFFTVEIPKGETEKTVQVEDAEVQSYYEENQEEFKEEEKVSIEYLELSVSDLMQDIDAPEEDVKALFDEEIAKFDASPEFEIAHLLIEEGDSSETKISEVKAKLAEDVSFDELVKEYSDDAGSKESGGFLGILAEGFPAEFSGAVSNLGEGDVSEPVVTDAGTHFVKVLKKTVPELPTFDSRKSALEAQIKRNRAEEIYVEKLELLGDLTYSASSLQEAAEQLNLKVLETELFGRHSGTGIAFESSVRNAAFEKDVMEDGHNSPVIELSNSRALVIRQKSHSPEHVRSLEEVKEGIVATLTKQKVEDKLAEQAEAFIAQIDSADTAKAKAEELKYSFVQHDGAKRTDPVVDRGVRDRVFAMAAPVEGGGIAYSSEANAEGNYVVVGLMSVATGAMDDVEPQQQGALKAQVIAQQVSSEVSAYQAQIIDSSDVEVY